MAKTFIFECPFCEQRLECDESMENQVVSCPSCKQEIVLTRENLESVEQNDEPADYHKITVEKTKSTKDFPIIPVGCFALVLWIVLIFVIGIKNMNAGFYVIFLPPIALGIWLIATKSSLFHKKSPSVATSFGVMLLVVFISLFLLITCAGSCRGCSGGSLRDNVESATYNIVRKAAHASGKRVSGFVMESCIIGDTKAVCHFHCDIDGKRHIGGIEFIIKNGKLSGTGQVYCDADD